MSQKPQYKPIFQALAAEGFNINTRWANNQLHIGSLVLSSMSVTHLDGLEPHHGILLRSSQESLRTLLRDKGISYIDTSGNVFLNMPHHRIVIEKIFKKNRPKKPEPIRAEIVSPSSLISPNSLAFIEAVLRKSTHELKNYRSVLHFCQAFGLYQPKASQIMKKMNSRTLVDLKDKLKSMPLHWWKYALESPVTKRKLTPFYSITQDYYSLDHKSDPTSRINEMIKKYPSELAWGPVEIAKSHGILMDQTVELWVSSGVSSIFKKKCLLIPGQKEGLRPWRLATPKNTLIKETIFSSISNHQEPNMLRAVWDMGFGDSRMREARNTLLERLLHEV